MACRVGITTDRPGRKQYWKRQHPTLKRWQILSEHRTKSAAQQKENMVSEKHGCNYHPGGSGPQRATWYVYHFYY